MLLICTCKEAACLVCMILLLSCLIKTTQLCIIKEHVKVATAAPQQGRLVPNTLCRSHIMAGVEIDVIKIDTFCESKEQLSKVVRCIPNTPCRSHA